MIELSLTAEATWIAVAFESQQETRHFPESPKPI
jgi:hypothetical protein